MLPVPEKCGADVVVTLEWIAESELALSKSKKIKPKSQQVISDTANWPLPLTDCAATAYDGSISDDFT